MNKKYNKSELQSIKLNKNIFQEIIGQPLSQIEFIFLSSNPYLSENQIERLFLENIDNVNINLLRNENCPRNRLDEFINLNDKIYNIAMAHNLKLDKKRINKLLEFNDNDVNINLKFNNLI